MLAEEETSINDEAGDARQPLVGKEDTVRDLHQAVLDNNLAGARQLLEKAHVNPDADQASITPLMRAASLGHARMVQFLLDAGARAFVSDVNGRTPLHYACTEFCSERIEVLENMLQRRKVCVQLLFRAAPGAATARNKFGQTPKELCYVVPAQGGPYSSVKFMDTRQLLWYMERDAISSTHNPLDDLEDDDADSTCCHCRCCKCTVL